MVVLSPEYEHEDPLTAFHMIGPLITLLYIMAGASLLSAALYLWLKVRHKPSVRWFIVTCLSLLAWLVTLYFFQQSTDPQFVLLLGRLNFAAASIAVYGVYRLVRTVASMKVTPMDAALLLGTILISGMSILTPWIDQAELITTSGGNHETIYGVLFPLYVIHLVGLLAASLWTAFRQRREIVWSSGSHIRDQLLLLGWGILSTSVVSLVTNIVLPYGFGNFDYIMWGPLSTVLLLLVVAYAVVHHQLFDVRIFLRKTLLWGLLLSLVLAAYSAMVIIVTDRFAKAESGGLTLFGVAVLFSIFDPIRRYLEKKIDSLLFPKHHR